MCVFTKRPDRIIKTLFKVNNRQTRGKSEWNKNHAHKHTIKHRRDTDVRVSHVPPLPSIYKVERRGWRRRENSYGFNFFASEAKTEEDRCKTNKQKTPAGTSPHVTLHSPPHCDQRWWLHATTRPHLNTSIMQLVRLHSLCKSANWCLYFFLFKPTHDSSARPRVNQTVNSLCERTRSKQSARSCDWRPPGKASVCLTHSPYALERQRRVLRNDATTNDEQMYLISMIVSLYMYMYNLIYLQLKWKKYYIGKWWTPKKMQLLH